MTYCIPPIHRERLSNHRPQETLLGMIGNLPSVLSDRHPCQRGSFVVCRQFDKQFFVQHGDQSVYFVTANYRICGLYNFTYNPSYHIDDSSSGLSERNVQCPDEKPLHIWNLHAGQGFGINFTLSEFTAPRSHGCADTHVMIDEKRNILKICPKFGTWNLIGKEHTVSFVLHYYQNPVIIDKGDQTSTKLSFYYQILDFRNTSLIHATRPPRKELVNLGIQRTLQLEPFSGTFQNLSNPRLELVLKVSHALVFALR